MWTYHQHDGTLYRADGTLAGTGYSGHNEGKNNPAMESVKNIGPFPRGQWTFTVIMGADGKPCDHNGKKAPVICFHPKIGTETFGRDNFECHGDSIHEPGSVSLGCMIMPHDVRVEMANSQDRNMDCL